MMDKVQRQDMLQQLAAGTLTVPEACERYKMSERHVRRLLSAYRKPKPDKAVPVSVATAPTAPVTGPGLSPDVKPMSGAVPVPPSMAEIDKALAAGGGSTENKGPDPVLTAEMALQGIRMAKMMAVITSSELMGVKFPDEKTFNRAIAIQPMTETVVRMQKPEAWAKLGELGSDPKALIGVLILDTLITGVMLWRMRPAKPAEETK